MKILLYSTVILALVACGEKSNSTNDATKQMESALAQAQNTETTTSVENKTLYFNTKSDLSECNDQTKNWLVYVKDEEAFYTCDQGEWAQVEIKGRDGSNGKDGENGTNGKDGKSTVVSDAFENYWVNPANQDLWLFVGQVVEARAYGNAGGCPEGFSLPDTAELNEALQGGLLLAAQNVLGLTQPIFWLKQTQASTISYYKTSVYTSYTGSPNGGETYLMACKKSQ